MLLNIHKELTIYINMRFPSLDVMIQYGIYTVKELERFSKGLVSKRNITILSECPKCSFVHKKSNCVNCIR
ncbi:hypothetical protein FK873_gp119 [Micromonas pusilla virus SP1]|uniref:Uncharacterized protein n=1 Tax=Micromonas pusilla virus SP1 TaxID=373996 RepID=G9E5V0_MPSP1|nr:hypothetical protein FK873_gp119 [Micromonas pusilla virus SP1]AET85019.1 hypothetical protein MPXG_00221 [Micromonas pusilla virus SP1]